MACWVPVALGAAIAAFYASATEFLCFEACSGNAGEHQALRLGLFVIGVGACATTTAFEHTWARRLALLVLVVLLAESVVTLLGV